MAKGTGIGEILHDIRKDISEFLGGGGTDDNSQKIAEALEGIRQELKTANAGQDIAKALEGIRDELKSKDETANAGQDIAKALEGIRQELKSKGEEGDFEYPDIGNGPFELVLAFNNDEFIKLLGPDYEPYFSSHGPLTDLHGNVLPGTRVATTFPVDPSEFGETGAWPPAQVEPFDQPPTNNTNVTGHGYSKQAYYFNNDKDWFVTIGPSLPKIVRTKDGGAQFWVGSIGVIAQGYGRFAGAKGVTTYVGSAYLEHWPDDFYGQIKILRDGFKALIGTFVKVVLSKDQDEPAEPAEPAEPSQPAEPAEPPQASKVPKPPKPPGKK
jgi:hypothetical protein